MAYVVPVVRSQFYDSDVASDESGLRCDDVSLTVQSEAEDADINVIVERFGITGKLPENVRMPYSGDFTGVSDFQQALNQVQAAQAAFMEFPADVRARFNHDPGELISFMENPDNRAEALRLGLVVPPVVDAGAATVAPTASPSPSA